MKGVILCAGKGTRLKPFTDSIPKTLLPIANKTILDRCLDQLLEVGIHEIAVVINPAQHQIKEHLGRHHTSLKITIIYQETALGILHALFQARTFVGQDDFVVLLGDNLFSGSLLPLTQSFYGHQGAIYLARVNNPQEYGIAEIYENRIVSLEEKPKIPKSNLAITGIYVFQPAIFHTQNIIAPSARGEYEITDAIGWLMNNGHSISYMVTEEWFMDVGTPERWLRSSLNMLEMEYGTRIVVNDGTTLENCTMIGPVIIGGNCRLRNSTIGPFVSIQDGSELSDCVIERSIICDNAQLQQPAEKIKHTIVASGNSLAVKEMDDNNKGR